MCSISWMTLDTACSGLVCHVRLSSSTQRRTTPGDVYAKLLLMHGISREQSTKTIIVLAVDCELPQPFVQRATGAIHKCIQEVGAVESGEPFSGQVEGLARDPVSDRIGQMKMRPAYGTAVARRFGRRRCTRSSRCQRLRGHGPPCL